MWIGGPRGTREAESLTETFEIGRRYAERRRLRDVFLASLRADGIQIEASLCEAIRIAKEQKGISLEKLAEASSAEYRRQKAGAPEGQGLRLPLC